MIVLLNTKEELKDKLKLFIWDFKISDNIIYNLNVLFDLIDDYNNSNKDYKKPISIISVSIIEAILVDFLYRLYKGTKHFPCILKSRELIIKNKLEKETIRRNFIGIDDEEHIYSVLKNFSFSSMIVVYKELSLIGDDEIIYEFLNQLSYFRNRVHINNYHNNFEKDENITFSEKRIQKTVNFMIFIFNYFNDNYSRPWTSSEKI